ncbi:MAG: polysulfide reductase NrfD [Magnetococcales bacterium]|nr:polysulfide reductase NrfD [Magnetococcales bacterium]NGZ25269.1 polysulfide reductase NrfD [Magnetococcales bacterium]
MTAWLKGNLLPLILLLTGLSTWGYQLVSGLQVTGMSNQVLWGVYIGNFIFLVGIAASAVVLVVPVYFFDQRDMAFAAVVGECLALVAVVAAMLFVTVDIGQPWRFFHVLPGIGTPNFPTSIMAWDMLVLSGYMLLNAFLVIRYLMHGSAREAADHPLWWMIIAAIMGIAIHTVTAFLLVANPARPFWHSAVLAPRFIASAFASGAGLMILALASIEELRHVSYQVTTYLRRVMTVTLLIHFFLLAAELFTVYHHPTNHGHAARLLFGGLPGSWFHGPWIWLAITLEGLAGLLLLRFGLDKRPRQVHVAAILLTIGVWMEKGPGLVIPAFTPSPLGEMALYQPTWVEGVISFTILAGTLWFFHFLVLRVARQGGPHV